MKIVFYGVELILLAGGIRATPESGAVPCGADALARVPEPFQLLRHLKIDAAIVIHFGGGSKVELRERNFLRGLLAKHTQRSVRVGIVPHFFHMPIAEPQRR